MKKALALILAAAMSVGMAVSTFALPDLLSDTEKDMIHDSATLEDEDGNQLTSNKVEGDGSIYTIDYSEGYNDVLNSLSGKAKKAFKDADVRVEVSNDTYAEIDNFDDVDCTIDVAFTNTTMENKTVKVKLIFDADDYADATITWEYNVNQAQSNDFTRAKAVSAFRNKDNIQIDPDEYATITEGAFDVMLKNDDRTITVVGSDYKIEFNSDSDNLDQDVYVGNIKTADTADYVAIKVDDSTATGEFKLSVGRSFYNNYEDADLVVYDEDGKATDIKATLQGDYTVNFTAAMGTYYVSDADFDLSDINGGNNNNNSTDDGNKDNPGMGSNDVVGVAVALAAMSLVAAGAVAFKKVK